MATQQQWAFRVSDGADPEVLTQLEGMYECPEFQPFAETTRDATTIDVSRTQRTKKYKFNRQVDGGEMQITCDYLPDQPAQARLIEQLGNDDGVDVEWEHTSEGTGIPGTPVTRTYSFNVLVTGAPVQAAASNDENAVDQVTFTLKVNSDPEEVVS